MKKLFLFILIVPSFHLFAQESAQPKIEKNSSNSHEIGINATHLFKQIISLSNLDFPTLPYDITYKFIHNNWAIRAGVGFDITTSASSSTSQTTSTDTTQKISSPDETVPNTNRSTGVFYRLGWEYRSSLTNKLKTYVGIDIVGAFVKSYSQNSTTFNNLPNSYSFSKNTDNLTTQTYGGGPVFGLQYQFTERFSIFTEMPIYFQYTSSTDVAENYRHIGQEVFGNGSPQIKYSETTITDTDKNTGSKMTITLPVTIYLALKF